MQKYLTIRNLGWVITAGLTFMLMMSAGGKLMQAQEAVDMLDSNGLGDWTFIIGLGEIIALILFLIPRTMTLGALLLSAYFGGAIVFHMSHPIAENQSFLAASIYLIIVWVAGWLRGLDIFKFT
jgi:uncharacterized membrane protein